MPPRISQHACDRWNERVRDTGGSWRARSRVEHALHASVTIPNRYACSRWVSKWNPKLDAAFRRSGTRYRFYPGAVLITNTKGSVITILEADEEDLAAVLVWLLLGCWT